MAVGESVVRSRPLTRYTGELDVTGTGPIRQLRALFIYGNCESLPSIIVVLFRVLFYFF